MAVSMIPMILLLAVECMTASTTKSTRSPETHRVQVGGVDAGGNPVHRFNPQFISAWPGDVVEFDFHAANYTATVSSFEEPCAYDIDDFDSGLSVAVHLRPLARVDTFRSSIPTRADMSISQTVSLTVENMDPIWMYCRQEGMGPKTHCQSGMVFAVNPKPVGYTFDAFLANALKCTIQVQKPTTISNPPIVPMEYHASSKFARSAAADDRILASDVRLGTSSGLTPVYALLGVLLVMSSFAIWEGLLTIRALRTAAEVKRISIASFQSAEPPKLTSAQVDNLNEFLNLGAARRQTDSDMHLPIQNS